ncbi:MAG: nucleoside phosphorylase [Bacteroidetes bacterium]|nr:nucleoside phosphorylase [Bacteroidota bacterium]MBK8143560.1 nucleoside phosphorylase [Bacteroidota bacterium]
MIGESELIITPKGKVYHINLSQDDLADTIITVGDPDRVQQVSKYFDTIDFKTQHREFVTHTGTIGKKRLTVLSSGIGPDNIDIVMNELDAVANIDFNTRTVKPEHKTLQIIRMGTSGSLQADIPVDSLVASSHGIGLDNVLHYYLLENNQHEKELCQAFTKHAGLENQAVVPYAAQGSGELLSHFNEGYHHGITVTCPGFYAPQGRVVRAGLQFPELVNRLSGFQFESHRITNFEMETSAIFGLGKIFGHQCLALNTIVANRITKTFTKDAAKSVDHMIRKSLEIISSI